MTVRTEYGVVSSKWCPWCNGWVSPGPSNDSPPEVQIEIRAAEIAADLVQGIGLGGHLPRAVEEDHCWHMFDDDVDMPCCYCGQSYVAVASRTECYVAALARQIATHDRQIVTHDSVSDPPDKVRREWDGDDNFR